MVSVYDAIKLAITFGSFIVGLLTLIVAMLALINKR